MVEFAKVPMMILDYHLPSLQPVAAAAGGCGDFLVGTEDGYGQKPVDDHKIVLY